MFAFSLCVIPEAVGVAKRKIIHAETKGSNSSCQSGKAGVQNEKVGKKTHVMRQTLQEMWNNTYKVAAKFGFAVLDLHLVLKMHCLNFNFFPDPKVQDLCLLEWLMQKVSPVPFNVSRGDA